MTTLTHGKLFYSVQSKKCNLIFSKISGLLGRAISCGSTYVRLGDHRPHVVGVDRKARVEGGGRGGGGESQGSLAQVFFLLDGLRLMTQR